MKKKKKWLQKQIAVVEVLIKNWSDIVATNNKNVNNSVDNIENDDIVNDVKQKQEVANTPTTSSSIITTASRSSVVVVVSSSTVVETTLTRKSIMILFFEKCIVNMLNFFFIFFIFSLMLRWSKTNFHNSFARSKCHQTIFT